MIARAARHLEKAHHLQREAEDALREAQAFSVAGEVDAEGGPPGDNENAARMLELHATLVEKASRHTAKAERLLSKVRLD